MEDLKQYNYLTALEELEYIFEGAMVPFVALGETARRIRGIEDLTGLPEVEIGVFKKNMSDYTERTLRDRWGDDWKNSVQKVLGVPIKIKYITRNYKFFDNPDQKFYYAGMVKTANPFENYWKARFIVQ